MDDMFIERRNSYMEIDEIYFWTATINKWQKLLESNAFKEIIINSFDYLSSSNKIEIYAFVIMPNHIHVIWKMNELNGKESPHTSFLKFTAHSFKKMLKPRELISYQVKANNKEYEFWQRDSLAINLFSLDMAYQKLEYLHNNPIAEHWQLSIEPGVYEYSSACFYESGISNFKFLKDIRSAF